MNKFFLLFIITLLLLFGQLLFCIRFFEPYPAVILPGFSNVPENNDKLELQIFEILAITSNHDTLEIPAQLLFDSQFPWHVNSVASHIIYSGKRERKKKFSLGSLNFEVTLTPSTAEPGNLFQFEEYIKEKLRYLTGEKKIEYVIFQERKISISQNSPAQRLPQAGEITGSKTIKLD